MYEAHYGLAKDPFRLSPESENFFAHPSYVAARGQLRDALAKGAPVVLLTGAAGSGKTTLLNDLLAHREPGAAPYARLITSQLSPEELPHALAAGFGLAAAEDGESGKSLARLLRAGGPRLLVIDAAQDLPPATLDQALDLARSGEPGSGLQVLLAGLPTLRGAPHRARFAGVDTAHLDTLSREQTAAYVLHRLRSAGWAGDPQIEPRAMDLLHLLSDGAPRTINLISGRLLLHGMLSDKHRLDTDDLRAVALDLNREAMLSSEQLALLDALDRQPTLVLGDLGAAEVDGESGHAGASTTAPAPATIPVRDAARPGRRTGRSVAAGVVVAMGLFAAPSFQVSSALDRLDSLLAGVRGLWVDVPAEKHTAGAPAAAGVIAKRATEGADASTASPPQPPEPAADAIATQAPPTPAARADAPPARASRPPLPVTEPPPAPAAAPGDGAGEASMFALELERPGGEPLPRRPAADVTAPLDRPALASTSADRPLPTPDEEDGAPAAVGARAQSVPQDADGSADPTGQPATAPAPEPVAPRGPSAPAPSPPPAEDAESPPPSSPDSEPAVEPAPQERALARAQREPSSPPPAPERSRPHAARPTSAQDMPAHPEVEAPGRTGTAPAAVVRPDPPMPPQARPDAPRPMAIRPEAGPVAIDRPQGPRPELERAAPLHVAIERPPADRPEADRPRAERPEVERPEVDRPEVERPEVERPEVERPDIERPDIERPERD